MASNVHIVPHMHWDREWYFTTEESRILLVNNMEEIMTMLEEREDYPYYVLDGQTAVLEDYFAVMPEQKKRVEALVKAGKLIVGPWYTQTDEMVVGAESIVRNLLYGLKDSKELGEPMMIGYLPDSFGQSEKLPQILNGFDIHRCIFWRGASERHGTNRHNFIWKGQTAGEVLVQLLPLGYAIGKYLPVEETALKSRMDKYLPVLDRGAVTEHIILPNGHDQMPIQQNIYQVMDQLKASYPDRNFFLSKYEHVFEELEKEPNLDTIAGELLDGKYMRVHRSIFSTRADLKSSNTRIENKITNQLEPLASIAYSLGAEYQEGLIEAIWKELMKNHAHDSIGCCCSDKVHRAIANRFFLAEDKTDELIRFYQRKIVDAMSCDECLDKLTAFNLLPYERAGVIEGQLITKMKNFQLTDEHGVSHPYEILDMEVVDAGLVDRQIVHYGNYDPFVRYTVCLKDTVPSMGYKTYFIREADGQAAAKEPQLNLDMVENEFYQIQTAPNGTLTLFDKIHQKTYHDVLLVEDGSDDGDEYDYSPLPNDYVITSKDVSAVCETRSYGHKQVIQIAYELKVPADLEERAARVCGSHIGVRLQITMKAGSPILEIQAQIDNQAKDHRVRVLIPDQIAATCSVSDNQFGVIRRPVADPAMEVWEAENWDERPDSIYPMLSYAGLDGECGLAVLTNSVREFEVIGETFDTIAVTLFRSVGYLGKEEMLRRPGRPSGIKLETPDSQMIGTQTYEFAIISKCDNLAKAAKEFTTPLLTYHKMPYNAMKLNTPAFAAPYEYSLLAGENPEFVLSALKKAQGKEGLILRGYQTVEPCMKTRFTVRGVLKAVQEVKLNEEPVTPVMDQELLEIPFDVVKSYWIR